MLLAVTDPERKRSMRSNHDGSTLPHQCIAIAHAARDGNGNWCDPHGLVEHSYAVGELAADFARRFGTDWARLAGRWHDLGKFRPRFQKYIRLASGFEADAHIKGEAGKAPHSTAGAMLAIGRFGVAGRVL